jgi:hypothetical protein
LIIGPEQEATLRAIRQHAETHPFTLESLQKKSESREPILTLENSEGFCCLVPVGYFVAFTIEHRPEGWIRHLSVAVQCAEQGRLPNSEAIKMIGRTLGMRMNIFDPDTRTEFEGPEQGPPQAVGIIEPMERQKCPE